MKHKEVCQLDDFGYFTGITTADESPLESGVYLFPRNTVDIEAPVLTEGNSARLVNNQWLIEKLPVVKQEPDEPSEPRVIDNEAMRLNAYRLEADPLFFKSQRGEATHQQWLDKVQEIKLRWPDVEGQL